MKNIIAKVYVAGLYDDGQPMLITDSDNANAEHWHEVGSGLVKVNYSDDELVELGKKARSIDLANRKAKLDAKVIS